MTLPQPCPKHGVVIWPDNPTLCTCPVLYGARHRKTGEWLMWRPDGLKPNPERPGVRCAQPDPGQVLANTHMHWRDAINTYRIVRIRKVKRRVPAPSKRLAAWVDRHDDRVLQLSQHSRSASPFAARTSNGFIAYGSTELEAKRALVKAMGKVVDS